MLVRVSIIQETFSISIKNFQFLSQNIFISIFILVRKEKRKQKIVIVTDTRIYFTQLLLGRGRNLTLTLPISNWCIFDHALSCVFCQRHTIDRDRALVEFWWEGEVWIWSRKKESSTSSVSVSASKLERSHAKFCFGLRKS
jgi:hypothetical protein